MVLYVAMPASPTTNRPKRVRLTPEARRDQLLDVAAKLLLNEGVAAVTMERVSERAGASRGLAYRYFVDRHDLLAALLDREGDAVTVAVRSAMAPETGLEGKFRAAVRAYFDALDDRGPVIASLLQAPVLRGEVRARQRARQQMLEQPLTQLISEHLKLSSNEAKAFVVIVQRSLPTAVEAVSAGAIDRESAEDVFIELSLGGLERLVKRRVKGARERK